MSKVDLGDLTDELNKLVDDTVRRQLPHLRKQLHETIIDRVLYEGTGNHQKAAHRRLQASQRLYDEQHCEAVKQAILRSMDSQRRQEENDKSKLRINAIAYAREINPYSDDNNALMEDSYEEGGKQNNKDSYMRDQNYSDASKRLERKQKVAFNQLLGIRRPAAASVPWSFRSVNPDQELSIDTIDREKKPLLKKKKKDVLYDVLTPWFKRELPAKNNSIARITSAASTTHHSPTSRRINQSATVNQVSSQNHQKQNQPKTKNARKNTRKLATLPVKQGVDRNHRLLLLRKIEQLSKDNKSGMSESVNTTESRKEQNVDETIALESNHAIESNHTIESNHAIGDKKSDQTGEKQRRNTFAFMNSGVDMNGDDLINDDDMDRKSDSGLLLSSRHDDRPASSDDRLKFTLAASSAVYLRHSPFLHDIKDNHETNKYNDKYNEREGMFGTSNEYGQHFLSSTLNANMKKQANEEITWGTNGNRSGQLYSRISMQRGFDNTHKKLTKSNDSNASGSSIGVGTQRKRVPPNNRFRMDLLTPVTTTKNNHLLKAAVARQSKHVERINSNVNANRSSDMFSHVEARYRIPTL